MATLALLATAWPALAQPVPVPAASCDAAGAEAERRYEIPVGLLRAIGRIESGRRDPATGQVAPWPWTINAEGRGRMFDGTAEAQAATRTLLASGVASIDVGCFQVNLMHHPTAFASLEDGFDPARNADYAARFLLSLRTRTGSWDEAVGAYHSATPERGQPYRDRVLASWKGVLPGSAVPGVLPAPVPVVRAVTWSPAPGGSGGMRIWTPSTPGQGASVIHITRG